MLSQFVIQMKWWKNSSFSLIFYDFVVNSLNEARKLFTSMQKIADGIDAIERVTFLLVVFFCFLYRSKRGPCVSVHNEHSSFDWKLLVGHCDFITVLCVCVCVLKSLLFELVASNGGQHFFYCHRYSTIAINRWNVKGDNMDIVLKNAFIHFFFILSFRIFGTLKVIVCLADDVWKQLSVARVKIALNNTLIPFAAFIMRQWLRENVAWERKRERKNEKKKRHRKMIFALHPIVLCGN